MVRIVSRLGGVRKRPLQFFGCCKEQRKNRINGGRRVKGINNTGTQDVCEGKNGSTKTLIAPPHIPVR